MPPVVLRLRKLPFPDLGYDRFEDLVKRLVERESEIEDDCRHYGGPGHDQQGIDLYARKKHTREYVVYQCKNERDFRPAKIIAAVSEFLDGNWADRAKAFVLCTREELTAPTRVEEIEKQRERLKSLDIEFIIWDGERLNVKLRDVRDIVEEFFPGWGKYFCPPLSPVDPRHLEEYAELIEKEGGSLYYASRFSETEVNADIVSLQTVVKREVADSTKDKAVGLLLVKSIDETLDGAKIYFDNDEYDKAEGALLILDKHLGVLGRAQKAKYFNILSCINLRQHDYVKALSYVEKAVEEEPLLKYRLNQINCLLLTDRERDVQKAKSELEGIPDEEREISQYYYIKGNYHFHTGDYEAAEKAFEKAIGLQPGYLEAMVNYAGTFLKRRDFIRFDKEIENLKPYLDVPGTSRAAKFHYYYPKGFRHLLEVTGDLDIFPPGPENGVFISRTLEFPADKISHIDAALAEFNKASEYAEGLDLYQLLVNKSFCLLVKKDYYEAKDLLVELLKKDLPPSGRKVILANLGDVYRILGEFDYAVETYKKAIQEFGPSYTALLFLGMSYVGMGAPGGDILKRSKGDITEGIKIFEKLLSEHPEDVFLKTNLGVVYSGSGELDKGEKLFKEIEEDNPEEKKAKKNLGTIYFKKGHYRKAFLYYRRYQRVAPDDPYIEIMVAEALGRFLLYPRANPSEGPAFIIPPREAKERARTTYNRRRLYAIKMLEKVNAEIADVLIKITAVKTLINLYYLEAELETEIKPTHEYLDKGIALTESLLSDTNLPEDTRPNLEEQLRFLRKKRYRIEM